MLTVITGPMWSGKTDVLISLANGMCPDSSKLKVFCSKINTRDGDHIRSRTGKSLPCRQISDEDAGSLEVRAPYILVFDEGQFFGTGLLKLAKLASDHTVGLDMLVAGLDLTSEKTPFGPIPELERIANCLVRCYARCEKCGNKAEFTFSVKPKTSDVRVGDMGYEPRCGRCHCGMPDSGDN